MQLFMGHPNEAPHHSQMDQILSRVLHYVHSKKTLAKCPIHSTIQLWAKMAQLAICLAEIIATKASSESSPT